jgi:hypothetical protein
MLYLACKSAIAVLDVPMMFSEGGECNMPAPFYLMKNIDPSLSYGWLKVSAYQEIYNFDLKNISSPNFLAVTFIVGIYFLRTN